MPAAALPRHAVVVDHPLRNVWIGVDGGLPIKVIGYELVAAGVGPVYRQARFALELGVWVAARFGA